MENLKLETFLSILLEKKAGTQNMYKAMLIFLVRMQKLDAWILANPKFIKVADQLELEGVFSRVGGKYQVNMRNYNGSIYSELLGDKDVMTFTTLILRFNQLWKGLKGLGNTSKEYFLLDADRTKMELSEFVKKHKEIDYETIISATEEYLRDLDKDENGRYLFAAKSSTFIKGTAHKDYLYEYCLNIQSRNSQQTNIKNDFKGATHGSTWGYV